MRVIQTKSTGTDNKIKRAFRPVAGFFGGGFSAFNHPLDVWVANCQKHRDGHDVKSLQVCALSQGRQRLFLFLLLLLCPSLALFPRRTCNNNFQVLKDLMAEARANGFIKVR